MILSGMAYKAKPELQKSSISMTQIEIRLQLGFQTLESLNPISYQNVQPKCS